MIVSKQTKELLFTRDSKALNPFLLTELNSVGKMQQTGYRDAVLIFGIFVCLAFCVLLLCFIMQTKLTKNHRILHKQAKLDSNSAPFNSIQSNQIFGLKSSANGSFKRTHLTKKKKSNSIECIICNKRQTTDIEENSSNNNSNLYEIDCTGIGNEPNKASQRTKFLIKFHPFTLKLPDKAGLIKSIENSNSLARKQDKKMSQRCCLSVSVVPFDKQSAKHKAKSKANIQNIKQAETSEDTTDDAPYTKDTQKLIQDKRELSESLELLNSKEVINNEKSDNISKSLSKNLNEIINSVSSASSTNGIKIDSVADANLIDYVNTIHTPSSTSSSMKSLGKANTVEKRLSIVSLASESSTVSSRSEKKKVAQTEFNLRINQLRFIDESASSTAVTSPMGSTSHLYWPKRQPQQQHKLLSSSSTSSSRTVSLPSSSTCSQTSSGQSTPKQILKPKRTSSIQRQANVQSSTETLCSEVSQLQRQHELLGPNYLKDIKRKNSSEHDDEEILSIIGHKNGQDTAQNRAANNFRNNEESYSEDDSYYSRLYAENKKLLEKTKMEKILHNQNKFNNDSDSSSVSSLSNDRYKKTYRANNKYGKQYFSFPSVRNGPATQNDQRIYAYDNFDCINECLEEHDQLNDNNIDEDEETSNLVEDGFIRMSSPVENDLKNSNNNINLDNTGLDSTTDLNDIEISNIGFSKSTNFPNVGSSPISDELLNTSSDIDGEPFTESVEPSTNFDGIIIHNSSDSNTNEIASLSDENEELNEEQDDFGFESFDKSQIKYLNSQSKTPHSIMKTKYSCLKSYDNAVNEVCTNSESAEVATINASVNSNQKPKVRFNLDIDYEKEREWSRINKIIGDVSKTQIEWTQEVEV